MSGSKKTIIPRWGIAVIIILAILPQVYKLTLPRSEMVDSFFPDDSFYYYKTALNIRNGYGSTFDTINPTNGYHPLWMLVCVGLAFITTNIYAYFYLVLSINLLFVICLSYKLLKMFETNLGFICSALLLFLINWHRKTSGAIFSGLETPLYLLLFLYCIETMVGMSWQKKTSWIVLGILVSLTFLARTSFILFVPVFLGYGIFRTRKDNLIRRFNIILYIFVTALIIAGPYLFWNYKTTGHFEQISGLTKNLWNCGAFESPEHFIAALKNFSQKMPFILQPRILTIIPLLLLGGCLVLIIKNIRSCNFIKDHRIILFTIFCLISSIYYFVFFGKVARIWHLAPVLLCFNIIFTHAIKFLLDLIRGRRYTQLVITLMICVIMINCFLHVPIYRYKFRSVGPGLDAMAKWIKANLSEEKRIGIWNAGYVGYFSERKVVNLDGLINGLQLYNYQKDGRGVWRYIIDNKLDYIGDYYSSSPPRPMRSKLKDQLEEVYHLRKSLLRDGKHYKTVDWYIWKVRNDQDLLKSLELREDVK